MMRDLSLLPRGKQSEFLKIVAGHTLPAVKPVFW
jgi:hypothetical protein